MEKQRVVDFLGRYFFTLLYMRNKMEFNVKVVLMATVLILGCISNGKSADRLLRVMGGGG